MSKVYLPIGWNCTAASSLEKKGLKKTTYPFDWTINLYDSIISVISNEGKYFLTEGLYIEGQKTYKAKYEKPSGLIENELRAVYDMSYKIILVHDLYDGIEINDIRKKYKRRIKRLLEDLYTARELILVVDEPSLNKYEKSIGVWSERLGYNVPNNYNSTSLGDLINFLKSKFTNLTVKSTTHSQL